MANLTLDSNQLFLGTFIITSSDQKYLQTAKWKLKYKELCSSCMHWLPCKRCLYCVRCSAGWLFEQYKLYSKFVLGHCFELKFIFFVMVLHWAISLVWSNDHLIYNCIRFLNTIIVALNIFGHSSERCDPNYYSVWQG